jgi:glycosyltransferase involved in cell wall biosynthesis
MQILQVTAAYYPQLQFGGPPQKIHALSRGLIACGYGVQVITFHLDRFPAERRAVIDGVNIHYLPWLGSGSWQLPLGLNTLRQAVRQADLVHCYGLYNLLCPAAAFLARRAGRPYLLEPLGMYVPRARHVRVKTLYNRIFTAWLARRAAGVVAASAHEVRDLSGLVADGRISLRAHGVDLTPFRTQPDVRAFRSAHGLGPNERLILYLGRISPIKNLEQLVSAFKEATLEDARLLLVGPMLEPDYAARLSTLIADLGLADRVQLAGPLYGPDKLAALAAADLFVLPSLSESFGNAAAEAVVAGVPVLLTETCGIAPVIHRRAGLAVPLTTAGLVAGLRLMLNDPEQRAALTRQRSDVIRELSWEEPLQQTEQIYRRIALGSTPAAVSAGQSL